MKISKETVDFPKEAIDFLRHSLDIDLRLRKYYEFKLFEDLHDLDKKYPFPEKGSLEEALFRERLS